MGLDFILPQEQAVLPIAPGPPFETLAATALPKLEGEYFKPRFCCCCDRAALGNDRLRHMDSTGKRLHFILL